jgi:hypothetical protein
MSEHSAAAVPPGKRASLRLSASQWAAAVRGKFREQKHGDTRISPHLNSALDPDVLIDFTAPPGDDDMGAVSGP